MISRSWRVRTFVAGVIVTLTASLTPGFTAVAEPESAAFPVPQKDRPVHGITAPVLPLPQDSAKVIKPGTPVSWPVGGVAEVTTGTGGAQRQAAPRPVRAGNLPVSVSVPAAQTAATAPVQKVRVEVADRQHSGPDQLVVRVRRNDGQQAPAPVNLDVDYSTFRDAFGGDWASRLHLVRTGCAGCVPEAVEANNDTARSTISAPVSVSGQDSTFVLTAAAAGSTGSYKATSLAPSASWDVAAQTGDWSWSYPFRAPTVPGGLVPSMTASYSSSSVDGRTASTNNQSSWLGEGWDLWSGYIERSYAGCTDDAANGTPKTGDQCWKTENATVSIPGHAGQLVFDAGKNAWRPEKDDGSKIEHLFYGTPVNGDDNGEYWKITTADGVQYFFGSKADSQSTWTVPVYGNDVNEPCHQAAFENSVCQQGYRWNLDHVVDTHGNTVNYFYARETNNYGSNMGKTPRTYTRGGTLLRAEYGTHDGIAGVAPAQLVFDTAERCMPGSKCTITTAADFPDVPVDMKCDSGPCDTKVAPTFWTTKRLAKITSKVLDGGKLRDVESWTFNQTFPDPGDHTSASLWLQGITHQGLSGTAVSTPPITFTGIMLANRVDSAPDGLPAMNKNRLSSVATESGGVITANYKKAECVPGPKPAPEANGGRCYPVHWTPDKGQAVDDWFHKYVVETVSQVDLVGASPAQTTSYDYEGAAAWAYDDNPLIPAERRTWSRWRGYEKVLVRHGTPGSATEAATRYQYFRGMNGDHLPNGSRSVKIKDSQGFEINDDAALNGFVREQITYSGVSGTEVTGTISQPEVRGPTATQGSLKSYAVRTVKIASRTALAAGGFRRTETRTKYDDTDLPIEVDDVADITKPDDDQCTRTSYVRNPGAGIVGLTATQETVGLACSAKATTADVLSRTQTYYDGHALDGAPTRGEVTKTEAAVDHAGADLRYVTTRSTYDPYGRVVEAVDPVDAKTTTKYVPDTGMPTSSTVTNALGQATTVTNDIGWGVPLSSVDPNGRRTDLEYDALGRLVKVWSPGRSKEYKEEPNITYGYAVRNNGPSWISTKTLKPEGNYLTSYALFDGFFRSRQTQAPAWGGGRVLTDTVYDDRGLVSKTNAAYFNDTSGPGTDLLLAPDNQVASQKIETYDAAGRPTVSTFRKLNDAGSKTDDVTTTVNAGDHTDVIPPQGGTTTSAYSDARGNVLESRQYQGKQPVGPADVTKYAYTKGGDLASVTDPAGNTWRFEYDLAHHMVKSTDPDKGVATMAYDDAGRMTSTTDSRGATIATVFDKLGRKTESHQDSATGPKLADWTYDTILKGLPTSSASYRDGNAYTSSVIGYDEANRPTGTRTAIPSAEGKLAGTYDSHVTYRADGSPSTMAMPAAGDLTAETLFIDYDSLGLTRGLGAGATRYVDNAAYTVFSEPVQVKLGNSGKQVAQTSYLDTATRRVTQVKTDKQGAGESHVDDRQYTYDPAGNITKIADTVGNRDVDIQCFDYDHVQRLTEAWTSNDGCAAPPQPSKISGVSPYWNSYRYDAAGNRTEETQHAAAPVGGDTTRKYTYPPAGQPHPHAVQAVDTTSPGGTQRDTYDYDTAGNTKTRNIAGAAKTLNWNPQGRLESDTEGDKKNDYVYDADGARLIRHDDTGATLYLGNQEVRFDKATNACSTTRYYSHNGQVVASRTKAGVT